jgi:hypothetical protein
MIALKIALMFQIPTALHSGLLTDPTDIQEHPGEYWREEENTREGRRGDHVEGIIVMG